MSICKELVELLLPEDILQYFELVDFKKEAVELRIFFEEKKDPPEEYKNKHIRANGLKARIFL